jgi:hypothetical protein
VKALLAAASAAICFLALPGLAQADVSIDAQCNGGACSTGWYTVNVTVRFVLSGSGFSVVSGCGTQTVTTDTDNFAASCVVDSDGQGHLVGRNIPIKRDATPPAVSGSSAARAPDSNGWYNHAVGVSFSGTDNLSGIASCTSATYGGPDNGSASVAGTCTDNAGNVSAPAALGLKYDGTAPAVNASPGRAPDANGWYNHPVAVAFAGTDATSGIDSCSSATYSGPDDGSAAASGSCRDAAGNSATTSFGLKYDSTAPKVSAAPGRGADANGWYNHPVGVAFTGTDAASGIDSCSSATYSGPDDGTASVSGSCKDNAGNSAGGSFAFKYDSTPPTVKSASPGRDPDVNGWYNHPLAVTFTGADALSGIDSCDTVNYDKPDDPTAKATGDCRDKAGNVSDKSSFGFKYDSTPPTLTDLVATPLDSSVTLKWKLSKDAAKVTVTRTGGKGNKGVYDGKLIDAITDKNIENGVNYTYLVKAVDEAGNTVSKAVKSEPSAPLFSPRQEARVHGSVALHWRPVAKAAYYNVQLWYARVKILSTWPKGPSFRVPLHWKFGGHSYSLRPGRYTWYVWPGFGKRVKHHFGARIGTSAFVVAK